MHTQSSYAENETLTPLPTPSTRAASSDRRRMERDLRLALRGGRLHLHYQPRIHLASGDIVSHEALIRWPDRRRGLVPPLTFLPVAERTELINAIGQWVLTEACSRAMEWPGDQAAHVSVNISTRQLETGALLDQIAQALDVSGLPPERLELEFTEAILLDNSCDTLLTLSAVRDLGVGLALDDFGTGYGSLSMLKRLPLTAMKLDRTLVRDLPGCHEDAAIVQAVIRTAHTLGLAVVAEGIETEEQRAFLSGVGCDDGQGYLFGRPAPAPDLPLRM